MGALGSNPTPATLPAAPVPTGLAGTYAARVEASVQRQLADPAPPPVAPSFGAWSALRSIGSGIVSGGLNSLGADADALSLFSGPAAATFGAMDTSGAVDQAGVEIERQKMLKGDSFDPAAGDALRKKSDTFVPDASTTTKADQVLHGLSSGLSQAVADMVTLGTVPGAVKFGLEHGDDAGQRARMAGVDTSTAFKLGATDAAFNTLGALAPVGGTTALRTLGIVGAAGPGSFMAQEALSHKILADAGYKNEASLHDPMDPLGLSLSIAIPGAFGLHHIAGLGGAAPSLQSVVQSMESGGKRYAKDGSLLTSPKGAQGEMQVMSGTSKDPGFGVVPAKDNSPDELARVGRDYLTAMQSRYGNDQQAMAAYNAGPGAVDKAIAAHGADWLSSLPDETQKYVTKGTKLLGDQVVAHASSDPDVVDAARVRVTNDALNRSLPGHPEAVAELNQASDFVAAGKMPDVPPAVSAADLIRNRFNDKLTDHDAAVAEYASRPDSEGGKVLNTDVARELSPDYLSDRTQSAAVHEPASAFVKRLYAEKLQDIQPGDQVMFTSGGTGAGKTRAISGLGALAKLKDDAAIVYDTNMNKLSSATQKIDQALAAGADVRIVHVQRDPVEAFINGALPRAMHQAEQFGTGRTVPLSEHARTHRGSAEVIQQLAEKYKDNPRVDIQVVDNTRGKDAQQLGDLSTVKKTDYNGLEGRLQDALKQQYDVGAISESVYRGTQGDASQGVRPPVRASDGAEPSRSSRDFADEPSQASVKAESGDAQPKSTASQRVDALAEANPAMKVQIGDETTTIADALESARAEAAHDASWSDVVKAAVECALSLG